MSAIRSLAGGLQAREVISQSATPPAGEYLIYPKNDGLWYSKDDTGLETQVSSSGGGGGAEGALPTEYTSATPVTPSVGSLLFTRVRARRMPAFVGTSGVDTRLQPHMFANNVMWMKAINASTATSMQGMTGTWLNNGTATPTLVTSATTNLYSSIIRVRAGTTATAGTGGGFRGSTASNFLSTTANMGGFHFICRFGFNTGATGTRGFVGLNNSVAAYSPTVNPSTVLNQIGFYWDATSTNLNFITSGTAVGTSVNLGANFPTNVAATNFYEVSLFAPSGGGQRVFYSASRLNDGAYAGSASTGVTGTTTMPALNMMLNPHIHISNGALAAAHSLDIQSLYIESDN